MKIIITDAFRYIWQMLSGFRVSHERALANLRQKDVEPFLGSSQSLRVLDLANGQLRPQYAILKAIGHKVYGIDLVNRPPKKWRDFAYRGARQLYRWRLGLLAKTTADQTLVCSQVSPLPFAANCFDLVTSVAAFEHFLDVPGAVAELHRVLRPAGLAWVLIHLFTSPSGAHNLTLTEVPLRTIPKGVDPWDHLRKRKLPIRVSLNEWRRDQHLEAFARRFEILKHYCAIREGEEFLTPEVQGALAQYDRNELTCGAYVVVARKKAPPIFPESGKS